MVGAGPAGLTAALLLAERGHEVTVFERGSQLGGLWASTLDATGRFRGDNSCKVYQSSYITAPALFARIGTTWEEHFVGRHDLTTDWLHPFVAASSWRDLRILTVAWARWRLGGGAFHRVSVEAFLRTNRISGPCTAWMRATALGGIAGTLRMTMWEFFHRIGSNIIEILRGDEGPLFWNARPQNTAGGFVERWCTRLDELGVRTRLDTTVEALTPGEGRSVRIHTRRGRAHSADAVFLALPPRALHALLSASPAPLRDGFGRFDEVAGRLEESLYEHLGISWFFDRPLPSDLPLGGHNVLEGWHPILVQHDQYAERLPPPAVSVVVGSVAIDTDFVHPRLGTRASDHSPDELARILWEDERRADPSLPEPIAVEISGLSNATQIVTHGPLPISVDTHDVFLATNLHGLAPYFTASLESAIQAGAIAAFTYDSGVEELPMGEMSTTPWQRDSKRRLATQRVPLSEAACVESS